MANTYSLVSSYTVSSSIGTVILGSIPSSYTDLQVFINARCDYAGSAAGLYLYLNSTSILGDSWRRIYGNGASAISDSASSQYAIGVGSLVGSTATANTFNNCSIYIPNYAATVAKSVSVDNTSENNGTTGYDELIAGLRPTTDPITSLYFTAGGYNFVANSTFYVYGISKS